MNLHAIKWPNLGLVALTLSFGLLGAGASGAPFTLSFLDEQPVLEDTCSLLRRHGFSDEATQAWSRLVERHNRTGNRVNRTSFPAPQRGYYQFATLAELTNRLSGCFYETPADCSLDQNSLMCFDVACLLLRGAGCGAPLFCKDFESKGVVLLTGSASIGAVSYQQFLSSNHLLYPAKGYEYLVGRPRSEEETQLALALRAARRLSGNQLHTDQGLRAAFADYIAALKRDGFAFPRDSQLGLALYVNLKREDIHGDHAFVCIPEAHRLICLEKNGSRGPYVRVEFKGEADLAEYMSWSLLRAASAPKDEDYGSAVVVSLNERLLSIYWAGSPATKR